VRLDRDLSQRHAAEAIGCHATALLHWEKGHAATELRFLPAILRFLGYDPRPEPATFGGRSGPRATPSVLKACAFGLDEISQVFGVQLKKVDAADMTIPVGRDSPAPLDWKCGAARGAPQPSTGGRFDRSCIKSAAKRGIGRAWQQGKKS
jgi:transcriptional regulator with XRE-family HTH domain